MKGKRTLSINISRIVRIFFAALVFTLLYSFSAQFTRADVSTCAGIGDNPDGGTYEIRMQRVNYLGPFNSNSTDSRADANDSNHTVKFQGWLYFKRKTLSDTVKNRPVLIYNHGHEQERGEPCAIVNFFVGEKNYVVFAPLRRGHSAQTPDEPPEGWLGIRSTGIHVDSYVSRCQRSFSQAQASGFLTHLYCSSDYCRPGVPCGDIFKYNATETDYLSEQRFDVRDQIAYIKQHAALGTTGKLADPKKIAILGHSYGGSLIILTNKFDYGQSVAISVSGAELSWKPDEPYWASDLSAAMESQERPIYFLQPKNGRFLLPTKILFGIATDYGYRSQASIFPKAPCQARDADNNEIYPPCDESEDPEWKQAHSTFIGRTSQLNLWGPLVIDFIKRYPR